LIVIDASMTTAWLLAEKAFSASTALLESLSSEACLAPPHWATEVGNAIRKAVRTRRILSEDVPLLFEILRTLNISIAPPFSLTDVESLVQLALDHGLSVYDAAYVRLAAEHQVPLATLDDAMKRAAHKLGVAVLPS
jgi:predicted nucleic acid-binding protein